MNNEENVVMPAVNQWPDNDLTRRKESSPEDEEDKMAFSAFSGEGCSTEDSLPTLPQLGQRSACIE
jgi:hypothetical protein